MIVVSNVYPDHRKTWWSPYSSLWVSFRIYNGDDLVEPKPFANHCQPFFFVGLFGVYFVVVFYGLLLFLLLLLLLLLLLSSFCPFCCTWKTSWSRQWSKHLPFRPREASPEWTEEPAPRDWANELPMEKMGNTMVFYNDVSKLYIYI